MTDQDAKAIHYNCNNRSILMHICMINQTV